MNNVGLITVLILINFIQCNFSVQLTFPIFFKCSKELQQRTFNPKIKWKDSFDMRLVDDTSNFKIALLSCFSCSDIILVIL